MKKTLLRNLPNNVRIALSRELSAIPGCSSKQTSIIKVSGDGIASYSQDHSVDSGGTST